MVASQKGHVEVVRSLIDAGANINHTNKVGIHPHCYCTLLNAPFIAVVLQMFVHVCRNNHNTSPITSPVMLILLRMQRRGTSTSFLKIIHIWGVYLPYCYH